MIEKTSSVYSGIQITTVRSSWDTLYINLGILTLTHVCINTTTDTFIRKRYVYSRTVDGMAIWTLFTRTADFLRTDYYCCCFMANTIYCRFQSLVITSWRLNAKTYPAHISLSVGGVEELHSIIKKRGIPAPYKY